MNILLVSPLPPPNGGMATWTEQYLRDSKCMNTVYIVNTAFIGKRALHKGKGIGIFSEILRTFKIVWQCCWMLTSKSIDIVHINSSCSKTGIFRDAICVTLAYKHRVVFHCHCNIQDQLKGRLPEKIGNYIFNRVDCILVLNKESLSYVNKNINKTLNAKVELIPNAIDKRLISTAFLPSKKLKNIYFIGHVKREKGIYELIRAADKERDIQFHVIGPVTDEISGLQTTPNVVFYGKKNHEDAMNMLNDADAFLFPSYTEGFSMVMLEAMAKGLPIIATDVGSNADMIESKGGVIIKPRSSDEIVCAIESIRPQRVRAEMSMWNLQKVKKFYQNDLVFQKIQEIYNELLV